MCMFSLSPCAAPRSYAWYSPSSASWRDFGRRGVFLVNTTNCTYTYVVLMAQETKGICLLSAIGCLICQTLFKKGGLCWATSRLLKSLDKTYPTGHSHCRVQEQASSDSTASSASSQRSWVRFVTCGIMQRCNVVFWHRAPQPSGFSGPVEDVWEHSIHNFSETVLNINAGL